MSKRFAFWFFLVGTVSSTLLFLILTVDTHKQVKALTHVLRNRLVQKKQAA